MRKRISLPTSPNSPSPSSNLRRLNLLRRPASLGFLLLDFKFLQGPLTILQVFPRLPCVILGGITLPLHEILFFLGDGVGSNGNNTLNIPLLFLSRPAYLFSTRDFLPSPLAGRRGLGSSALRGQYQSDARDASVLGSLSLAVPVLQAGRRQPFLSQT